MYGLLQPIVTQLKCVRRVKPVSLALLPLAMALAACSTVSLDTPKAPIATTPSESAQLQNMRAITTQQDRLYRIAAPLLVSNAPLCKGNARNLIGFSAKNKYSFSEDYVDAAQVLGFTEQLQVTGVLNNSGAARAGIKRGDILATVEGQPMPAGANAERQAAAILGPMVGKRTSIKLGLTRTGNNVSVTVPLTLACGFGIELGNADNVNAYADGRRVLVTRGMLNFVRNDGELAFVLAKELAHNALGHPSQQKMNATVGGIIDNLIRITPDTSALGGSGGVRAMPQELDAAADRLALYMLTRAGYNIDGAAAFWQRLATQYPASVPNAYTAIHPSIAYRVDAINKANAEIKGKQAAKKPLMP
ncbi:M48 family metallopeptidase [Herminiimonas fonticola]|uniref:Peptidase M48-like protein n=1 Tax=Herminiimonas fonticola TaxID=303380 RepID=A0A4R6G5Q2_9BURK|nr:M48 family metallopeptidase [Herminiimonas fonticola]RBA23761.1 Peptidase family M48 [Herminiimonas fonticola]TDN89762.1 peptidase M48-like protein [Herminiimonas fonticola]